MLRNLNQSRVTGRVCGTPHSGVLASAIPTDGEYPALGLNDIAANDPAGCEYSVEILTWPAVGTLRVDENTGFDYTPPSAEYVGVVAGTQRVRKNGVTVYDEDYSFTYTASSTSVSADLVASYGVQALVSADLAASYAVASATSTVSADLAASYAVNAYVSASLTASYAIEEAPETSNLVPKMITVTLQTSPTNGGVIQANLTGLFWTWQDVRGTITSSGSNASTNGAGAISVTIQTALATGAKGILTLDNWNGANDAVHLGFIGPVAVP